jgi:hypothetical protein
MDSTPHPFPLSRGERGKRQALRRETGWKPENIRIED